MLVLDTNIWIHAVTVGGKSKSLVDEIVFGDQRATVGAYIHEEVRENIDNDHSIDREIRDQALEQFYATVFQCPAIRTPELDTIEQLELETERQKAHNKLIGTFGDIQTKDAPILTHAYQCLTYKPTIVTNDKEFASLSPADHGIPEITIRHVDLEWKPVTKFQPE